MKILASEGSSPRLHWVGAGLLGALLTACGGSDSDSVKVGLITKTDSNPFFVKLRKEKGQRWVKITYFRNLDLLPQLSSEIAVDLGLDEERAAELIIQMNDILIEEIVVIPQVNRAADKYAISNNLNNDNVALSPFEFDYWNVANWNRV